MSRVNLSRSSGAVLAGTICLVVLGGMIVGHAWPLWTGRDVVLAATIVTDQRSGAGDYLRLSTAADLLRTGVPAASPGRQAATVVRTVEPWVRADPANPAFNRSMRGRTVYVQLEPGPGGEHVPVSVSLAPVRGAVNLRGLILWPTREGDLSVHYGLDAFYMQEGRAESLARSAARERRVQLRVAIASSGRARIRELIVDGQPVR